MLNFAVPVSVMIARVLISISLVLTALSGSGQGTPREVVIFHAGSLSVPLRDVIKAYENDHPGIKFLTEAAGSIECARKITDLGKPCDIMLTSDYQVIRKLLYPDYCDWYLCFVGNEMTVAFTDKSAFSSEISPSNWYDILAGKDVIFGRSDPNMDPCGYRTLMTLQLAEKLYGKKGLAEELGKKDLNFIRPKEVDLLALLEAGALDYIFIYKSVAVQHGLRYLELPAAINLKEPSFEKEYAAAAVTIRGKEPGLTETMKGEPIVYGVTLLKQAPNRDHAIAFLDYMLDAEKGMKIFEKDGHASLLPCRTEDYDRVPPPLKKYCLKPE
jgi:molybdate/tungstate transport system substrate-binding protein